MAWQNRYGQHSPGPTHCLMLDFMAEEGYGRDDATEIANLLQDLIDDYEGSYEHFLAAQGAEIQSQYGATLAGYVFDAIWWKCSMYV